LVTDPEFATVPARRERRDRVAAIIQAWARTQTKAQVVSALNEAGVPGAPVNNVAEMVADPQVQAREMFVEVNDPAYGPIRITGTPLKLSETPGRIRRLAPLPGEHNEAIFVGLFGHTKEELEGWRKDGVI